jgi:hypothetical protein
MTTQRALGTNFLQNTCLHEPPGEMDFREKHLALMEDVGIQILP